MREDLFLQGRDYSLKILKSLILKYVYILIRENTYGLIKTFFWYVYVEKGLMHIIIILIIDLSALDTAWVAPLSFEMIKTERRFEKALLISVFKLNWISGNLDIVRYQREVFWAKESWSLNLLNNIREEKRSMLSLNAVSECSPIDPFFI